MSDIQRSVETVFRMEAPRLIAGLARIVRDVGLAEELAQDALVVALEKWPQDGVPDNPAAWLMQTAKHRAIDRLRHKKMARQKHEALQVEPAEEPLDVEAKLDDNVGDDLLRLVFTACHPLLPQESRVALTLRVLCGLTTEEIARAFLLPETTIAQRIVRAKKTLADAAVPFEVPRNLAERLPSVLEVVYLVFNEGYAATAGDDWLRPGLCEDALRLGRILVGLMPSEGEVHGLLALMELQASRSRARVGPLGEPVLLLEQNRTLWDHGMVQRGLAELARAEALGRGPYTLQAAIAACHARALQAEATDWTAIAALYAELVTLLPSPVIELNRAVAVGMAFGPAAGLAIADTLLDVLPGYHLLPSVRGDLLFKLGRRDEARAAFQQAAGLTKNTRERALLLARAEACVGRA